MPPARASVTLERMLPKVLILYTGGTFGMDAEARAFRLPRVSPSSLRKRLLDRVPELASIARCDVEIRFNRDSAHMGPDEWLALSRSIGGHWKDYDGFVVLHGTDTLAYTASALSFLLRPCPKPVVLTGAMRPLSALRTDARRNLISSVEIAARGPRPLVSQVTVFFDHLLFQGNRVRKRSASDFGAFESPKAPPIAQVGATIHYEGRKPRLLDRPKLSPSFSRRVAMVHVTPGMPARPIAEGLLPHLDGLVLVVFPSVTGPTHEAAFLELFKSARAQGVAVVIATDDASTLPGAGPSSYAPGRVLLEVGCHWAASLTPECAFVKASLLLGQAGGRKKFARLWGAELAGEGMRAARTSGIPIRRRTNP